MKAIEDFEAALKADPNHANGKKYMCETLVAVARNQEDDKEVSLNSICMTFLKKLKKNSRSYLYILDLSKSVQIILLKVPNQFSD